MGLLGYVNVTVSVSARVAGCPVGEVGVRLWRWRQDSGQSESEGRGFDLRGEGLGLSARTWITAAAKGHHRNSNADVFRRLPGRRAGTTVTAVGSCAAAFGRLRRVFFGAASGSSLDLCTQPDWGALATVSGTSKVFSGFLREPAMFNRPGAGGN